MKLQRELTALRPFAVTAAILVGLFLLVSAPRYHAALTPSARVYTLCAFSFLFAGAGSAAFVALGAAARPKWPLIRIANGTALAAALAVGQAEAASPVPGWLLILLGLVLTASCWWPPPIRR